MATSSIRFGVYDGQNFQASTWKCWAPMSVGKSDVYLACRRLGGILKASLHQSGSWQIGYIQKYWEENLKNGPSVPSNRHFEIWSRPKEIFLDITLAFRIVTPWSAVNSPCVSAKVNHIIWIPYVLEGKAREIDIFISAPNARITNWPGKRSLNTSLVGSMKLDSGENVWIVHREIEMPNGPNGKGQLKFHKGKGLDDLKNKSLRALLFGQEPDGSRVIYDCAAELGK